MTTITTTFSNQAIKLPKQLALLWQGKEVLIRASEDTIMIKKLEESPSLPELRSKMKKVGKFISKKDLEEAIKWARKK